MAEYIEREAICRAYIDLCLAKSKLEKSRRGAAFYQSDLLPEVEPTVKELFGLINAAPAADVAPVGMGGGNTTESKESPCVHGAVSSENLMTTLAEQSVAPTAAQRWIWRAE